MPVRTWGGGSQVIGNLQVLRAVAAIGVVFFHTAYSLPSGVHTDFLGVATFFVISGFIMCFITSHEADGFLTNRLIRIVPLYWLCIVALILGTNPPISLDPHWLLAWARGTTEDPKLLGSLLFVPMKTPPVLGVGWTLNLEIYFYVVFAGALWLSRRFAPLIAGAVILAVLVTTSIVPDLTFPPYYSHSYIGFFLGGTYIGFFLGGIAVFYLWRAAAGRLPRIPTAIASGAVIVFAYAVPVGIPPDGNWAYALPLMIVGAALLMASAGADITWRPLILLGDSSYALYLTHTILFEEFRRFNIVAYPMSGTMPMVMAVLASIGVGIAVHLWIEKPLNRMVKRLIVRLQAPARSPGTTAAADLSGD